jgi:sulfite exporter TauE/SafE
MPHDIGSLLGILFTAGMMGFVGGPHCVAMCGGLCAAMNPSASPQTALCFHAGRICGYTALGGIVAGSMSLLAWLTQHSSIVRPIWQGVHLLSLGLGLMLLVTARSPQWLMHASQQQWRKLRTVLSPQHATPILLQPTKQRSTQPHLPSAPSIRRLFITGALWALMPCGLLHAALLIAALTGSPARGALAMLSFAVGSSASLLLAPWLWLRLKQTTHIGDWGMRLAGGLLMLSAGIGLWLTTQHTNHATGAWCI